MERTGELRPHRHPVLTARNRGRHAVGALVLLLAGLTATGVGGLGSATAVAGETAASTCTMGHGRIGGPAGPRTGTGEERIARVIAAAQAQTGQGLSYSWGGGGKGGPSCGISSPSPGGHVDHDRLGFDCSGYTLYAYWKGAGIDIGGYTGAQYSTGRRVPYAERRPGDLIFWGTEGVTSHVAIYLGDDRMLEAAPPRGSDSVHEIPVYSRNRFPSVVRVIS
jgi:cell wall-associated NlpC family hydrolase